MNIPRLMIAAPKSGSGKTLLTMGVLGMMKKMNKDVIAYKCGPDYIDPMFHRAVWQVEAENLDIFFAGEDGTKRLFCETANNHEISVIEGVMGLFDGLGGTSEEGSAYHIAKVTDTPIVLVVDVHGMGHSMIPLIKGFEQYDRYGLIKGIVLNRISETFYKTMKPLIEKEISIPLLGFLPKMEGVHLESRHLGLVMPDEINDIKRQLDIIISQTEQSIGFENILKVAEKACEIKDFQEEKKEEAVCKNPISIAVAKDRAFCFYYGANIRELEKNGINVKYFSPLEDDKLPEDVDGLLLGGGYPELYAQKLSENESMKNSIRNAITTGMPLLAECGGFMYLHKTMADKDGNRFTMVGVIDGNVTYQGRSIRFGYIEVEEKESLFLKKGEKIKAHEFHYFDSSNNGEDCTAVKPVTGKTWECIHENENSFVGFPHLYYPSAPGFVRHFAERMREYSRRKRDGEFL